MVWNEKLGLKFPLVTSVQDKPWWGLEKDVIAAWQTPGRTDAHKRISLKQEIKAELCRSGSALRCSPVIGPLCEKLLLGNKRISGITKNRSGTCFLIFRKAHSLALKRTFAVFAEQDEQAEEPKPKRGLVWASAGGVGAPKAAEQRGTHSFLCTTLCSSLYFSRLVSLNWLAHWPLACWPPRHLLVL